MVMFQSDFVFGLQGNKYQEFIDVVASPIIQEVVGCSDYEVINYNNHLSFKDFENKRNNIFSGFYTSFFSDIVKVSNKIDFKIKVCLSFDERLCCDVCSNTGRRITTIKVGGVKLVYFILFDIKEFFDFVYSEKSNSREKLLSIRNGMNLITKMGYICNSDYERGFSSIRFSIDDKIILSHDDHEILSDLDDGDFVELLFESDSDKYPVRVNLSSNQNEIVDVVKRFTGILTYPDDVDYALIHVHRRGTNFVIYVKPSLANECLLSDNTMVRCLASKDESNRWQAEVIKGY